MRYENCKLTRLSNFSHLISHLKRLLAAGFEPATSSFGGSRLFHFRNRLNIYGYSFYRSYDLHRKKRFLHYFLHSAYKTLFLRLIKFDVFTRFVIENLNDLSRVNDFGRHEGLLDIAAPVLESQHIETFH